MTFAEAFGFPSFYGRNMEAWIDWMTGLDEDAALTIFRILPGEVVVLWVSGAGEFKERCPEVFEALIECSAFVNHRRIEAGAPAILALAFG